MQFRPNVLLAAIVLATAVSTQAQTLEDLKNDGVNPNNVLTYGMGYNAHRFSTLTQINKKNIRKLVPAWALSLENDYGELAQPLVKDGVIYVADPKWTVAIDGRTGKQLWRTAVDFDPDSPRAACCGVANRGAALYNGLVFRGTLDAFMVALDQKTGKEVWKTEVANWKENYTIVSAPLLANGVLITGMSGGDMGTRGFLDGYDPMTGKRLWRFYTTAAPDQPGGDTWPVKDSYKTGGGATWFTGSYDPELDLIYWGTGNADPFNPNYRGGDSLYTCSLLALRPKTGELVWHYQFNPNELFDYDASSEPTLADVKIDGKLRKVVFFLNKNGFAYVLDRTNGKLLAANPFAKVNWASHIDLTTGRPVETEVVQNLRAGKREVLWPSYLGAKNYNQAAYNPKTGLLYANTLNFAVEYNIIDPGQVKPGKLWIGVSPKYLFEQSEHKGYMEAIDPLTGKAKWRVPLKDNFNFSAMLATASGLLFTGRHTGEFIALDADNGKQLWQFQTSSGINSSPITWAYQGKQYVTVLSGLGGVGARYVSKANGGGARGGSVWTFALPN